MIWIGLMLLGATVYVIKLNHRISNPIPKKTWVEMTPDERVDELNRQKREEREKLGGSQPHNRLPVNRYRPNSMF